MNAGVPQSVGALFLKARSECSDFQPCWELKTGQGSASFLAMSASTLGRLPYPLRCKRPRSEGSAIPVRPIRLCSSEVDRIAQLKMRPMQFQSTRQ